MRAGFYYDVISNGHFVPGDGRSDTARYRGKAIWQEVLEVTEEKCVEYFLRVHENFNAAVGAKTTRKEKAPCLPFTYSSRLHGSQLVGNLPRKQIMYLNLQVIG